MAERCNCEHIRHYSLERAPEFPDIPRDGHAPMAAPAGQQRALYVGKVCDDCAATCVAEYLITE